VCRNGLSLFSFLSNGQSSTKSDNRNDVFFFIHALPYRWLANLLLLQNIASKYLSPLSFMPLWFYNFTIFHKIFKFVTLYFWVRSPQQMLRTHRSLEAYCATL
jgi:hypothetical protein